MAAGTGFPYVLYDLLKVSNRQPHLCSFLSERMMQGLISSRHREAQSGNSLSQPFPATVISASMGHFAKHSLDVQDGTARTKVCNGLQSHIYSCIGC